MLEGKELLGFLCDLDSEALKGTKMKGFCRICAVKICAIVTLM